MCAGAIMHARDRARSCSVRATRRPARAAPSSICSPSRASIITRRSTAACAATSAAALLSEFFARAALSSSRDDATPLRHRPLRAGGFRHRSGSDRRAPSHRLERWATASSSIRRRDALAALFGARRRAPRRRHAHGGGSATSSSRSRCAAATAGRACSTGSISTRSRAPASAGSGHSDFTAFQLAALAHAGMVTFAGPMAAYDFGAASPSAFTLEHCWALLGADATRSIARSTAPTSPATARCGAATWRWSRISSARRICRGSTAASCSSRTSASIRTGSSACSISCTSPACSRGSARCCSAASTATSSGRTTTATTSAAMVAHVRARFGVPIYTGLPFGHCPDKLTLPVGGHCALRRARRHARGSRSRQLRPRRPVARPAPATAKRIFGRRRRRLAAADRRCARRNARCRRGRW